MMPSKSDVEHWQINATVYKDRVEERHYITDPARNIRRIPQTKIWQVERSLGRGGFGEVRLEKDKENGKARADKRIPTTGITLSNNEFEKELKALLEFSKPKASQIWMRFIFGMSLIFDSAVFVDFFGWFRDGSDVFLAMEYVPLGDLESNVAAHSGKISEIEARDITQQILLGLEIMHAESFAHRDLKPQVNGHYDGCLSASHILTSSCCRTFW
jgi:serine/threonine protein kinase